MNTTILALALAAVILIAVAYIIRSFNHVIGDLFKTHITPSNLYRKELDRHPILDWNYYDTFVQTIRQFGCTSMVNFSVTPMNNVVCRGSVTRTGLVNLLEEFDFTGNGLTSSLRDNLIKVFEDRTLITQLINGDYLHLTYHSQGDNHFVLEITYARKEAEGSGISYIGNAAREYWTLEPATTDLSLADIFLLGIGDFKFTEQLPQKYNDNLQSLISVTNCLTGGFGKYRFVLNSLDINSTKSSTPTLYSSFILQDKPSSFWLNGLNELALDEEFGLFMVSQGMPLVKYNINAHGGFIRIDHGEYHHDITVGLTEMINEHGDIRLDITIVKRRNKVLAAA